MILTLMRTSFKQPNISQGQLKGIPPLHKRSKSRSKMISHAAGPTLKDPSCSQERSYIRQFGSEPVLQLKMATNPPQRAGQPAGKIRPIRSRDKKITFTFWRLPCKILKIIHGSRTRFQEVYYQKENIFQARNWSRPDPNITANELSSQGVINYWF